MMKDESLLESTTRKFFLCCSLMWPIPASSKPVIESYYKISRDEQEQRVSLLQYLVSNDGYEGSIPCHESIASE